MKSSLTLDIIYSYLSAIIIFLAVPIYMIGYSPEDYKFINFSVLLKSGFLFTIFWGALLGISCLVLHAFKLPRFSNIFIFSLLLWVLITGFLFPVSVSTAMTDPINNPINEINLIISSILILTLIFVSFIGFKKYIEIFIFFTVITTTLYSVFVIYDSKIFKSGEEHLEKEYLSLSNKKNILVISFDGMPGESTTKLVKNSIVYSETLKDFIIYEGVISQTDGTAISQIGDLFGTHDLKSKGDTLKELQETLTKEGLADKLLINQVKDSYQYNYRIWGNRLKFPSSGWLVMSKITTIEFFKYPIVRTLTRKLLSFIYMGNLVKKLQPYLLGSDLNADLISKVQNSKGPGWDRKNILDIESYNSFVNRLSINNKKISIRYLHFTFTHFPMDFDEECNFRSDDKEWYISHQNEAGIVGQGKCGLNLILKLLNKLKELGIYDNTLIVFKSDHGKPTEYYCTYPNNLSINGNRRHGYSRFRPTLMIKDFNADKPLITYRPELVLLNDLAVTLCKKADLETGCESFPGVDLLSDKLGTDDPYYLYVVKDSKSKVFFRDHISVRIPSRNVDLLEAMKESPLINLSIHGGLEYYSKRITDLATIKNALSKYHNKYKRYPLSRGGWNGAYDNSGNYVDNYIKGLVPEFLDSLPTDPRGSNEKLQNYLYMSNGKDFKFLIHDAPNFDICEIDRKYIDPRRSTRAYGIWSEGAKNW